MAAFSVSLNHKPHFLWVMNVIQAAVKQLVALKGKKKKKPVTVHSVHSVHSHTFHVF